MGLQINTSPAGVNKAARLANGAAKAHDISVGFQTEASTCVFGRQFIEVGVCGT